MLNRCRESVQNRKISKFLEKDGSEIASYYMAGSMSDFKFPWKQTFYAGELALFKYMLFNKTLSCHYRTTTYSKFSVRLFDMKRPCVCQPGEAREYGVSLIVPLISLMMSTLHLFPVSLLITDFHKGVSESLDLKTILFDLIKSKKDPLV
jgi:hypothetical protein